MNVEFVRMFYLSDYYGELQEKKGIEKRHPGLKPESQTRQYLWRWYSILPKVSRLTRSRIQHQKLLLQCSLRDQGNNKKHW